MKPNVQFSEITEGSSLLPNRLATIPTEDEWKKGLL